MNISISTALKLSCAIVEGVLSIPIVGLLLILGLNYIPLLVLIIFHVIGLISSKKDNKMYIGHIIGIIGNAVSILPYFYTAIHLTIAIFMIFELLKSKRKTTA